MPTCADSPLPVGIPTWSGKFFNPLDPKPEDFNIRDIARGLSMTCRFQGQIRTFYSVAEHSVHASYLADTEDALWALLHDASEAYISDVSGPVKHTDEMTAYRVIESSLQERICRQFGLSPVQPDSVHRADDFIVGVEARDLMGHGASRWPNYHELVSAVEGCPIRLTGERWSPDEAERRFLGRYVHLEALR